MREGGAESFYYRSLKDPYDPSNRKLEVLEELLWVKGMTPDIFRKLRGFLTVWGDGKININTASREVLLSVGCTPSLAEKIVVFRNGNDEIPGTPDDKVFDRVESIPPRLSSGAFLGMEDEAALLQLYSMNAWTVSSVYFTVKAQGTVGGRTERIDGVLDRSGKISSWRE
jgi:Type II secretion system (T2SS), protein K